MKIKKKEIKNSTIVKPKKNLSAILGLGLAIIVIAAGLFFAFSKMFATETYYTLNQNVAAKTKITTSMLTPQETAEGTAPKNALDPGVIQGGDYYAKYPINQGDVVTTSNAGTTGNDYDGIPEDWVVGSFVANANTAVDGNLRRGDYFDFISGKEYKAHNLLLLDVTSNSTAEDKEGKGSNSGASLVYTIGLPADEAPELLSALNMLDGEGQVQLVRSPMSVHYEKRTPATDTAPDLIKGTDDKFTPIVRDGHGKPKKQQKTTKETKGEDTKEESSTSNEE